MSAGVIPIAMTNKSDRFATISFGNEAVARLIEIEASIRKAVELAQPHIELIARNQRQIDELARAALQSSAVTRLAESLSSITAVQKSIDESLRVSSMFESMQALNSKLAIELTSASSIAALQKFDAVSNAVAAAMRGALKYEENLRAIAESVASQFKPAQLAYAEWHSSIDLTIRSAISLSTPARENFLATDLLGSLQEEKQADDDLAPARITVVEEAEQEILITLPGALQAIDPELYRLWKGAWDALFSENPDRVRHSLTSARELVTHVLHALTPDRQIQAWSADASYFHNGKPTRRARLMYLLSPIESEHLKDYLKKEIDACLALIDMFQVGTHSVCPPFSDMQVRVILRKVHSMICTLVEVRNARG